MISSIIPTVPLPVAHCHSRQLLLSLMHSFRGTCFRLTGRRWFIRSFHHIEADVYCIWDFHCLVSLAYAADKNYKHMIHGHVVLSEFLHKTKNTITNANKKNNNFLLFIYGWIEWTEMEWKLPPATGHIVWQRTTTTPFSVLC